MWLERISGGGADLIELADAKAHLRLLEADFDIEVGHAIKAATAFLDIDEDGFGGLGFPLIAQQWATKGAGFTCGLMRLPLSRVTAINEVRYIDPEGVSQVVTPSDYHLVRKGRYTLVSWLPGRSAPAVQSRPDAAEIRFTAGFATASTVPEDIKAAARLLIGHFFENRSATEGKEVPAEIALGVESLVGRYRRFAA